ncbi:MAG: hypothetical protein Q8T11_17345, partial [Elusimicrobiota bacterium]|nr:hypothetical protein [Elusimicrobiota bacterium]
MIRRLISSALIASLLLLTPGDRFYEACAQTIASPAARAGVAGGAGSAAVPRLEFAAPSLTGSLSGASLAGSLSAAS